jgi:transposase
MGDLSYFERGQIVVTCIAGASVTKPATSLGVSRATVSKAMSAYTNHGKATSAKRNSGRNSTLTEKNRHTLRRTVSKNHISIAAQATAELNIILKTRFPQKLFDVSFTNPTSNVWLQLLNLWLPKIMLRFLNDGVATVEPGHQTTGNA